MANDAAHTVVVTGGSGYIGSELIKQLLEKGYNVRATVRDLTNTAKVAHLEALGKALPGNLQLYAADLLQEGSFDEVIKGAAYVFHTASPFFVQADDPQKELVDPAVKGTRSVLNSVVKSKDTVKRVVLTSSVAAVRSTKSPAPPINGKLYTEEDWNNQSTLDTEPYPLSKVLAEKAAWELAKAEGLDLVTINPVFVIGPVLSARTDATSIQLTKGLLEGQQTTFTQAALRYVDVRDVARAHILAAEEPTASGRYIVSHPHSLPGRDVVDIVKARHPRIRVVPGVEGERQQMIDNGKARALGIQFIPEQQSFADMAATMVALGVAKPTFE